MKRTQAEKWRHATTRAQRRLIGTQYRNALHVKDPWSCFLCEWFGTIGTRATHLKVAHGAELRAKLGTRKR